MMLKNLIILVIAKTCFFVAYSQEKQVFSVDNSGSFDTLELQMKVGAANCKVRKCQEQTQKVVQVFSTIDPKTFKTSSYSSSVSKKYTVFRMQDNDNFSLTKNISYAISSNTDLTKPVKLDLIKDKVYNLDLSYGFGEIDLNLSDISVNRLKIKTGTASISIKYDEGKTNVIEMDTLKLKTGFGEIHLNKVENLRAKLVETKVGFGNIVLDFDKLPKKGTNIKAAVGGGDIEVYIPDDSIPVMIIVRKSPFTSSELPKDFEEVDDNLYVNKSYKVNAKNLIKFELDVSMGNLVVGYKN